jgi:hypothetical protein
VRLHSPQVSLREILVAVVLVALWMVSVRFIEQTIHWSQIPIARFHEQERLETYKDALSRGETEAAFKYRQEYDDIRMERLAHESQAAGHVKTFSTLSTIVTVLYLWAVVLFLIVQAEHRIDPHEIWPIVSAQTVMRRFHIWLGLGLIAPVAILVIGFLFGQPPRLGGTKPWSITLIGCFMWAQFIHTLAGILFCRELRWPTLFVGIPSALLCATIGFAFLARW